MIDIKRKNFKLCENIIKIKTVININDITVLSPVR